MRDFKKILFVFITIGVVYTLYFFQDAISAFVKDPKSSLEKWNEENAPSKGENVFLPNEKVTVKIVDEQEAVVSVVEKASPAVVSIVRKEVFFDPFRGPFRAEDSIGTGFVIDGREGIILTNKHVVGTDGASYSVVFGEGDKNFDVEKVYRDPVNDFAILKIAASGDTLPELELGDSDTLKKGQTVIAIGNALGEFGNSITKGVVSGLGRGITARAGVFGKTETIENVIQTDAALNPGNSGGPLLNLKGEVIGINVAISQGAENIGFSIPINILKPVIDSFYKSGKISRPFLGVEYIPITKDIAQARGFPVGAFVKSVVPGSPAYKAGIKPEDIIIKLNGERLDEKSKSFARLIAKQEPGKEIEIVVVRKDKEVKIKVTLEDLEE